MNPIALALLLFVFSSLRAYANGFELGTGVPMTNGIASVNFNSDKGGRVSFGTNFHVGFLEVEVGMRNGTTNYSTVLYSGAHGLKVPLKIESVKNLATWFLLPLLLATIVFITAKILANRRRAVPITNSRQARDRI
ncbi:MAG: hypothetical protein ABI042_13705 [Verrucomicrobiota bacterium]